eukprot:jgi/Mesvir1/6942/Mv09095-RA.1
MRKGLAEKRLRQIQESYEHERKTDCDEEERKECKRARVGSETYETPREVLDQICAHLPSARSTLPTASGPSASILSDNTADDRSLYNSECDNAASSNADQLPGGACGLDNGVKVGWAGPHPVGP